MVAASGHTALLVVADALKRAGSSDASALRDAISNESFFIHRQISFNALGEVQKDVQVQVVKGGNWHHHSVIMTQFPSPTFQIINYRKKQAPR